jgi:hypothetical protein
MGESGLSGRGPGLDAEAKLALFRHFPNDSRRTIRRYLRFEIRADNGRFSILPLPPRLILRRGTFYTIEVNFSRTLFLSGQDFGLVSVRRACYRLVWHFSIPADSPRVRRGISCSRNRGLGLGIRA